MLDRTEQRILGVLLEKELSVPDSYPMTENAIQLGCNQKSNRDPEMALEAFEVAGALMAMQLSGWVVKVEGSRADKYRHQVEQRLNLDKRGKALLAELLVRGPQAPGALKPRVARMGWHATPEEIEALLDELRGRGDPLVELLPRAVRERDARWAHRLGPRDAVAAAPAAAAPSASAAFTAPPPMAPDLEARVAALESEVAALAEEVARLRGAGEP